MTIKAEIEVDDKNKDCCSEECKHYAGKVYPWCTLFNQHQYPKHPKVKRLEMCLKGFRLEVTS